MAWDIQLKNNVAVVTINSNKGNKQDKDYFQDVHDTLDILEKEYPKTSVIFTAEGDIFSVGLDIESTFSFLAEATTDEVREWFALFKSTNLRLFSFPAPTIAAINGHAIAGGTISSIVCDYRIAANKNIKMGLTETQVGMPIPSSYIEMIKFIIGKRNFALAGLFGQTFDLQQSKEIGFIHEIADEEKLLDRAMQVASSIRPQSMDSYITTKKISQHHLLKKIEAECLELDELAFQTMKTPESLKALAQTYEMIKGVKAPWLDKIPA